MGRIDGTSEVSQVRKPIGREARREVGGRMVG